MFTAWNYGIRNSLRAHEITRILCKINGMEINYFARLAETSDKCRVSSSRHRLKRVSQNPWLCNLSSSFPFSSNFRLLTAVFDDTVDVPYKFSSKMSRAENRTVPILLLQIKLSSRYIVCRANSQEAAHFWQPNYLGLFRASQTRFAFVKTSNYFVSRILP